MLEPTSNNLSERFIWVWYVHFLPEGYVRIKGVMVFKRKWWHMPWFFWFYELKNRFSYLLKMNRLYKWTSSK